MILLMVNQHWFRKWFGAIMQQIINWMNVDQVLWCHGITSLQWVDLVWGFFFTNLYQSHVILSSEGRWKVWVTTDDLPSAGTTAQVTLTVYGEQGNSGPIPLGNVEDETFQPGEEDEFEVSGVQYLMLYWRWGLLSVWYLIHNSAYKCKVNIKTLLEPPDTCHPRYMPLLRGKGYVACVRLAMLHGSEDWCQ